MASRVGKCWWMVERNKKYKKFGTQVKKICKSCGKEFYVQPHRSNIAKFCSKQCKNIDLINVNSYSFSKKIYRSISKYLDDKCELCKSKSKLLIHHKDGNHLNNEITNLMVICRSCHNKIHPNRSENRRNDYQNKPCVERQCKKCGKKFLAKPNQKYCCIKLFEEE